VLEAVQSRWSDYRRALRRHDQPHFDRLFEYADAHADAAGYLNADDPMQPILFSMLLEQQKRLAEQRERLELIEQRLDDEDETGDTDIQPPRTQ
jgi:hypothetical protein